MKKISLFCIFAMLFATSVLAQRDSLYMFDMNILPNGYTLKVYLYTEDGKIDSKKPFSYFTSNGREIAEKDLRKEHRIKLKRNRKLDNKHSYIFKYKGMKDLASYANYTPRRNEYFFYSPLDNARHYQIERFVFEYEDTDCKKLKNIKIIYRSFATGVVKIRDYKP